MLLSHSGNYPCKYENLKFAANDMIGLKKYWKKLGLTNGYECLRVSYECPCESCECPCESCECLQMPLRILKMLANACYCLQNCCENNENIISRQSFHNTPWTTANAYEHLRMSGDWIRKPIRHHICHCVRAALTARPEVMKLIKIGCRVSKLYHTCVHFRKNRLKYDFKHIDLM
jgi:hypothetical protein